jgi:hypothetical protein
VSWKSYAVVSGATVLAGWLASTPPSNAPESAVSARPSAAPRDIPASGIEREAERLQVRVRREVEYAEPQRNPFRFGAGRADAERGGDIPAAAPQPPPLPPTVVPPIAPPPPVSLSGIAEDQDGQRVERTAILSSPSGVLLVHEGDPVLGDYRVSRIEAEAVELVKTDGSMLRLTLSKPKSQ